MATTLRQAEDNNHEKVVRRMIAREDELTNQRMLWTATFNGLLFTSLGFAWDKPDATFFRVVVSVLGFATSFLNGLTLIFAANAQRRLLLWWKLKTPKGYAGPGVIGAEPLDARRLMSM
jgi:hypothetical protein